MLTDPDAARLNEVIGHATAHPCARRLQAPLRLYWFTLEEVIEQDYAHDRMPDVLYVVPSLGAALGDVQAWLGSREYETL